MAVRVPMIFLVLLLLPGCGGGRDARMSAREVSVAFHRASYEPGTNMHEVTVDYHPGTIHVADAPFLTERAITSASAIMDSLGRPAVSVTFGIEAAHEMGVNSEALIGKPMAIYVDGVLVAAPVVKSRFTSTAIISGSFTDKEVSRIVGSLQD